MKNWLILVLFFLGSFAQVKSQRVFTHADTLRGSITPERSWWNLLHYTLDITPDIEQKTIRGTVIVRFRAIKPAKRLQIDLQQPLVIDSVFQKINNKWIRGTYTRDGNACFITLPLIPKIGIDQELKIFYGGKPKEAVRAPWDGGLSWKKDAQGNPFVSTSCQGLGASVWWPCKDHQYDEPEHGVLIRVKTPDKLTNVSNGKLKEVITNADATKTWVWEVKNPINNYSVSMNIGKYDLISDTYQGEKGQLPLNYYVLAYNRDSAIKQFVQVKTMLQCFENWFGAYPFYEDGFKLVEVPYLGMEHQSNVAYGNKYRNGYLGRDLSGSGWGLKWDYIIVHESGHEWFGNNITSKDIADMWIHEGFTTYSETLYTECQSGRQAANEYNYGLRKSIQNKDPIIGTYNVQSQGSQDMYFKSSAMIHSIRNAMNDDKKFKEMLRGLNSSFYHGITTTSGIQKQMEKYTGFSLKSIFEQYLFTTQVPSLEYYFSADGKKFFYRYTNCVDGFNLKLNIPSTLKPLALNPTVDKWQSIPVTATDINQSMVLELERNYYINLVEKKEGVVKTN
ncbi:MAG: M1 family metallopeptidase [Chitinophagaceae bacterium]|nr:M1 family metallopeptidase [Chitinophagaceae bacterium]